MGSKGTVNLMSNINKVYMDNTWYNFKFSKNGNNYFVLINELESQSTSLSDSFSTGSLVIGNTDTLDSRFQGSIDEFKFWSCYSPPLTNNKACSSCAFGCTSSFQGICSANNLCQCNTGFKGTTCSVSIDSDQCSSTDVLAYYNFRSSDVFISNGKSYVKDLTQKGNDA